MNLVEYVVIPPEMYKSKTFQKMSLNGMKMMQTPLPPIGHFYQQTCCCLHISIVKPCLLHELTALLNTTLNEALLLHLTEYQDPPDIKGFMPRV